LVDATDGWSSADWPTFEAVNAAHQLETSMTIRSAIIAAALLTASNLSAQETESHPAPQSKSRWEFLVLSGTLVPTGAQRDVIRRADLSAAQLTFVARPALALTSTVGWARSRDVSIGDNPKLDVFTYDIGAELRSPRWTVSDGFTLSSFAGAGAGGRSYNYRKLDVDATHNISGYATVGTEVGVRRVHVRLEARDYLTGFKPLNGIGASRTGNDVVVMAGLHIASR
jgi:hypothetical protein